MKLSIITINYNNLQGLKRTAKSIISQTIRDFEWILIDGGSSDGSSGYISDLKLDNRTNITFSISENDRGVYNAMNKGIMHANGEYCLFLNSGDKLHSRDVLEQVMASGLTSDIMYGNVNFVEESSSHVFLYPDKLSLHYLLAKSLGHPASFIRTYLLKQNGYREDFRIISDWYWFLESFRNGYSFRHLPLTVSDFDMTGISTRNRELQQAERKKAFFEVFGEQNLSWIDESIDYYNQVDYYNDEDLRMATHIYKKGGKRLALLRYILRMLTCYDYNKRN